MNDMVLWIWLSLSVTPGGTSFKKLIEKFKSPDAVYKAEAGEIISCIGSKSQDYNSITNKSLDTAKEIYDFCLTKSVGILTYSDPDFPAALRKIDNPPVLLYYRGELPDFNSQCFVSVVGTRRLTDYGRKNAFSLAIDLARSGAIVVSGMATGVDGVAMAGAISAGGSTVAFLGSGIDVCYPPEHLRLAREIVKGGCVMTEYSPGTKPEKYNFPRRNRLISGISAATVVIEGRINSGAIITARCARLQGKAIYALPGNVDNKTSEVTNLLIKNGAKLITDATDIIKDFEFVYPGKINPFSIFEPNRVNMTEVLRELEISCVTPSDDIFKPSGRKRGGKNYSAEKAQKPDDTIAKPIPADREETASYRESELDFDKDALRVYKKIPYDGACSIEDLAEEGFDMRQVMRTLLKLEMGKFIVMLPGEKVMRNRK